MKVKYIIGIIVGFLMTTILIQTGWVGWNTLIYNDEIFGYYFEISTWLGQSLITIISSIVVLGFYKFFKQKGKDKIPSMKANAKDILITTGMILGGYLLATFLL